MKHYAFAATWVAAASCAIAFGMAVAHGADAESDAEWTTSGAFPPVQGALDRPGDRVRPMRVVSISKRPDHSLGRQKARAANELPAERRASTEVVAKDIRAAGGTFASSQRFSIASFTRPLPVVSDKAPVEVRAITRTGRAGDRLVVAQHSSPESQDTLRDTLRTAASVVSVDVGKPVTAKPVRRVIPSTSNDTTVTIVGRPGAKVQEVSGTDVYVVEDEAPVINKMSTRALEQEAVAREELVAKNEELHEEREGEPETEATPDGEATEGEAAVETPPAPPGPRVVETERRYDWRKGYFVRVPKDSPEFPAPEVTVAPAGRVGGDAGSGAPLRGKVPRMPKPAGEAKGEGAEATPEAAAGK